MNANKHQHESASSAAGGLWQQLVSLQQSGWALLCELAKLLESTPVRKVAADANMTESDIRDLHRVYKRLRGCEGIDKLGLSIGHLTAVSQALGTVQRKHNDMDAVAREMLEAAAGKALPDATSACRTIAAATARPDQPERKNRFNFGKTENSNHMVHGHGIFQSHTARHIEHLAQPYIDGRREATPEITYDQALGEWMVQRLLTPRKTTAAAVASDDVSEATKVHDDTSGAATASGEATPATAATPATPADGEGEPGPLAVVEGSGGASLSDAAPATEYQPVIIISGDPNIDYERGVINTLDGGTIPIEDAVNQRLAGTGWVAHTSVVDGKAQLNFITPIIRERFSTGEHRLGVMLETLVCASCDLPATRCQAHHINAYHFHPQETHSWNDLTNLCRPHNRANDDDPTKPPRNGRIERDDTGWPAWQPEPGAPLYYNGNPKFRQGWRGTAHDMDANHHS